MRALLRYIVNVTRRHAIFKKKRVKTEIRLFISRTFCNIISAITTAGGSDKKKKQKKKQNTQMCFVLHTFLSALQLEANPPTPSQMEL